VIAGDGVVERMLLTGMAGDLAGVARMTGLPLGAIQCAIRGDTLTWRAADAVASQLRRGMLKNTQLKVSASVLSEHDLKRRREAVALDTGAALYLTP
jgi:hypothetical protein